MAACALTSLCVGRHATARTRSLASQWSSSSTSKRSGVSTIRPCPATGVAMGSFSTVPGTANPEAVDILPTAVLQKVIAATSQNQSGKTKHNKTSDSWDLSTVSSLLALAATGSVAMLSNPSYTSAEAASSPSPSPINRPVPVPITSPRSAPIPMATSSQFATAPSPLEMAFSGSTIAAGSSREESSSSSNQSNKARPKVQIRRTVRRRYGDAKGPFAVHDANHLPERFRFTKYDEAAECEGDAAAHIVAEEKQQSREFLANDTTSYEVSVKAFQGRRESMEDEVEINGGGRFAAVFDGHGGGDVSMYLKQHLYHLFLLHLEQKHWEESDSDLEDIRLRTPSIPAYMAALRQALHSVETEILRHSELNFVGSTAVAVVLHENPGGYRTLISANVGDSRAVLCRNGKAVELTKDHKPTAEGERKRILQAGGRIFLDDTGVHRVMNLSLSRAIGDGFSKPIVSSEPDIRRFRVEEGGDQFFLLASDGLWDVMSSQDAVDFVNARLAEANDSASAGGLSDKERAEKLAQVRRTVADSIVQEAFRCGSADNTSCVIVWLQNDPSA